ncbi:MAG: aminotransferase class V-fold PLP-dependent enzyme [Armatimonadota bacterium]
MAVWGLDIKPGDTIVTTLTKHNSVLRPLNHLADRTGVKIVYIGLDQSGELDLREAQNIIAKEKVSLVAVNHISNVTGRTNPVEEIFSQAKAVGAITLLDASQSLGRIQVHPLELKADLVAFTCHKAIHGPLGTGGLYVDKNLELRQVLVGGAGVRSEELKHPPDMPLRLEQGTPNVPAFASLAVALDWYQQNKSNLSHTTVELTRIMRAELRKIPGGNIIGDSNTADMSGIISFRILGWNTADVGYVLQQSFGIICRTGLHCAPLIHKVLGSFPEGTVRFSVSGLNSAKNIEHAIRAVRRLAA